MVEEKQKSGIKKYMLGLAATFALGLGVGTVFSDDIKYAFWRAEKLFIDTDQAIEKKVPEGALDYQKQIQYAIHGWTEEEARQKREKFMSELDSKIKKYEQGSEKSY